MVGKRRKYKREATLKQIKALQYISQGMSKRKAMIKAGYSLEAAGHPTRFLLTKPAVRRMITNMAGDLTDEGLTTQYMVQKFKEWLEAQKVVVSPTEPDKNVPDYKTQLEAYKEWKKIMDQHEATVNPSNHQIKRRLTIDEFITGKEDEEDVIVGDTD